MTTRAETKARRRELTILMQVYNNVSKVTSKLADKYDCAEGTVRNDWSRKSEWMREVWEVDDAEAVLDEALAGKRRIIQELWKVYRNADSSNAGIGALRTLDDVYDSLIDMMQSIGEVEKAPEKHEVDFEGVKQKLADRLSEGTTS